MGRRRARDSVKCGTSWRSRRPRLGPRLVDRPTPAMLRGWCSLHTNWVEHLAAIRGGGGKLYVSGLSASSRGLTAQDLGLSAEFVMPGVLINLVAQADRVLCY